MFNQIPLVGVLFESAFLGGATSTSTTSSFSFGGQPFGTANTGRYILVGGAGNGTNVGLASCTIGGVAASLVAGNSAIRRASLWLAPVPTGTSGTISITMNATSGGAGILIWSLFPDPVTVDTEITNGGNLTIPTDGVGIGVAMDGSPSGSSISWSGMTVDSSVSWTSSGTVRLSGARSLVAGTPTISISGTSGGPYGFATASFRA